MSATTPEPTPTNGAQRPRPGSGRTAQWVTVGLAVAILLPSMYGFIGKFIEFVALARGDAGGVFAISPIMNYLLASLGFLCLFGWAMAHGMFRDIEAPKYAHLEREAQLDARRGDARG